MLYYRRGVPSSNRLLHDGFVFPARQNVSFDTYFNMLSVGKWVRYTHAENNFSLKISLKGSFTAKLLHVFLENNFDIDNADSEQLHCEVLAEHKLHCEEMQSFKLPFEATTTEGCFAFSLLAEEGSQFGGACFVSDVEDEFVRPVRLGVGICTFKREKYVLHNIANIDKNILQNPQSPLREHLEVFISDNASTLPEEVSAHSHVHVFQNKNTGGSGGFTRCMIEAIDFNRTAEEKLTDITLMDDDVRFETESLERVFAVLSVLKKQYEKAFVGGAMFTMARPFVQHASGEFWYGERCENFIETYNSDLDMSFLGNVLRNEIVTDANYQAWWFCTIPMCFVREDNLSMPFFIKSDDIEYSIRNMRHLILLNGVNVWHESFETKYSAPNEYYTIRNYLVTTAAHNAQIGKHEILLLLRHYYRHYACNYKYKEIEHMCNAVNDFLKGVDHLKNTDMAAMHKKLLPQGYKMVDVSTLPVAVTKEKYQHDTSTEITWDKAKWKLAYYTVNGLFLPAKGYAVLGMWGGNYAQTYRKKFLVRYEPATKKGFILYRSRKEFLRVSAIYRKTKRLLKRKFDKAYAEFRTRWKELCTLDAWKKYLDLDD